MARKKRSYDDSSREETVVDDDSLGSRPTTSSHTNEALTENHDDWQLVEGNQKKRNGWGSGRKGRRHEHRRGSSPADAQREEHKEVPDRPSKKDGNRPAVSCAQLHKLNSSLKIGDLQQLVLYCVADGVSPQWLSVRHHHGIKRAVVLMVPGLEKAMFTGEISLDGQAPGADDTAKSGRTDGEPLETGALIGGTAALSGQPAHGLAEADAAQQNRHGWTESHSTTYRIRTPDQFLPIRLDELDLPGVLLPFGSIFEHVFPIEAPGDANRVHSPVGAILTTGIPKSAEEKKNEKSKKGPKAPRLGGDWKDEPTPVPAFIATTEQLMENDYVLHPASCLTDVDRTANEQRRAHRKATPDNGWKDARITGAEELPPADDPKNQLAGRRPLAIDCEMVKVAGVEPDDDPEYVLARISIRDWKHQVILDELVKPPRPVVDYVTAYSGMTEAKLAGVETTLSDIQEKLLDLFTPDTILVGHSLDSDMRAMRVTHPYIIDTSIIFPHPRGPPMKSALKWLTQKYLGREIQKHTGGAGHDSIEDADAAMDLLKEKCKRGPRYGTSDATTESIFKRLARTPKPGVTVPAASGLDLRDARTGAVVDHGHPERNNGAAALVSIPCTTDDEVVAGIKRCVNGDPDGALVPGAGVDLTFARFRELEAARGWAQDAAPDLVGEGGVDKELSAADLAARVAGLARRVQQVHDALPKCTLLVVYSGVGDPRDMRRYLEMQRQFRREYAVKKWDEISVKWTDVEEQGLKRAVRQAREGVGFVAVT